MSEQVWATVRASGSLLPVIPDVRNKTSWNGLLETLCVLKAWSRFTFVTVILNGFPFH